MKELVNSRTHSVTEYRAYVSDGYFVIQIHLPGFTKDDIDINIDKSARILRIHANSIDKFFGRLTKFCEFDIGNNINIEYLIETALDLGILTLRFMITKDTESNICMRNKSKLMKILIK